MRVLLLALAALSIAAGKPRDRTVAVRDKTVTLPAAWLTCKKDADCVWVSARCTGDDTGVNERYEKNARRRLDKACAGSGIDGVLTALRRAPPACKENVCEDPAAEGPGMR